MLEILVHVDPEDLPESYQLIEIEIPEDLPSSEFNPPEGWKEDLSLTREAYDEFCREAQSPVFSVPSVVMPRCRNILINPRHELLARLRILNVEKHPLDPRFLGQE